MRRQITPLTALRRRSGEQRPWRRVLAMNAKCSRKSVNVHRRGLREGFQRRSPAPISPPFLRYGISWCHGQSHVPAVHMNCRFLTTTLRWVGVVPTSTRSSLPEDTDAFTPLARRLRPHDPPFSPLFRMGRRISGCRPKDRAGVADISSTASRSFDDISPSPATSAKRSSTIPAWSQRMAIRSPTRPRALLDFAGVTSSFTCCTTVGPCWAQTAVTSRDPDEPSPLPAACFRQSRNARLDSPAG